jgi:hypothetical protein
VGGEEQGGSRWGRRAASWQQGSGGAERGGKDGARAGAAARGGREGQSGRLEGREERGGVGAAVATGNGTQSALYIMQYTISRRRIFSSS